MQRRGHALSWIILLLICLPCLLLESCGFAQGSKSSSQNNGQAQSSKSPSQNNWLAIRIFPDLGGWAYTGSDLFHTGNGGRTWQKVTPDLPSSEKTFSSPSFTSSQSVWFVHSGSTLYLQYGQKQQPELAKVFHSGDGGKSWSSAEIPDTANTYSDIRSGAGMILAPWTGLFAQGENRRVISINSITSTDAQHAAISVSCVNWHTGGGEEVVTLVYLRTWQTTDGGASWQKTWETTDQGYPINGTAWTYVRKALEVRRGTTLTSLQVSTDAGQQWQEAALPIAGLTKEREEEGMVYTPTFFDAMHGSITMQTADGAQHFTSHIFVTETSGKSWQLKTSLSLGSTYTSTTDPVFYLDQQHWFTISTQSILTTRDSGIHWQRYPLPQSFRSLESVNFISPDEGWAIGRNAGAQSSQESTLLHTTDAGKTWTTL